MAKRTSPTAPDALRTLTPARVGLARAGGSLATREVLRFDLDHARARDAVRLPFDAGAVAAAVTALGLDCVEVRSAAATREAYLQRPDLGRRLDDTSRRRLAARAGGGRADLALIVGDGLSSGAIHAHAAPLLAELLPRIRARGWRLAPVAVAALARVALADEIGAALGARASVILIGERPGLSAADSMGAYLTFDPRVGRTDAERNCVSNIRAHGLAYAAAAAVLCRLLEQAFARGLSGVRLKDEGLLAPPAGGPALDG